MCMRGHVGVTARVSVGLYVLADSSVFSYIVELGQQLSFLKKRCIGVESANVGYALSKIAKRRISDFYAQ